MLSRQEVENELAHESEGNAEYVYLPETLFVETLETALALYERLSEAERERERLGKTAFQCDAILAENREMRVLLEQVIDGDDVVVEAAVLLHSGFTPLAAAEVARVKRLEQACEYVASQDWLDTPLGVSEAVLRCAEALEVGRADSER